MRSDDLHKLCRRLGGRALEIMGKEGNGDGEGSLQIRLISYYMNWEGEWSREKELADWNGFDLASLKHRAYRTVVRIASDAEDWPGKRLHQMEGHVSWAVFNGVESFALELCSQAIELAVHSERFRACITFLQLEREVLERLSEEAADRAALLADNVRKMVNCHKNMCEIERMEELRLLHYEPLKFKVLKGTYEARDHEALAAMIAPINFSSLQTIRATVIFLSVEVPYLALIGKEDLAYESGKRLIAIYKEHHWLRIEKRRDFLDHYSGVAAIAARCGDQDWVLAAVSELGKIVAESPNPDGKEMQLLAWINLLSGITLAQERQIAKGLKIFCDHEDEIGKSSSPKKLIIIYFWAAVGSMRLGNWKEAAAFCATLIGMKSAMLKTFLANIRVIRLLCLLHLPKGRERITSEVDAVCKFLRRQEGDQTFLLRLTQSIGRLATIHPDNIQGVRLASEQLLAEVNRLKGTASGVEALKVYDYGDFFERYIDTLRNYQ